MPTIYLDLDGVLADFGLAARTLLFKTQDELDINGRWPDKEWVSIRDQQHFYRNLPLMPRARELVTLARGFRDTLGWDLYILTAIPHKNDMPHVFHDKIDWVNDYFSDIRVHFGPYSEDKQHHCQPGDILVDDRVSNCEEWRARGGIAVKVGSNYGLALDKLAQIYISFASQTVAKTA
jgi:5'(3')-deoxyribonucleotidase